MSKKKILHLITGLEIGGTERQILEILPYLQNDFNNQVCSLTYNGPIGEKLREKEIKTQQLNFSLLNFPMSIWKFRKIIKEFQPDILVTYLIHSDLFGRFFGRLFGVKKIVCSKRGALLQWEWLSFFDKLTKKLITHYLVQTETARAEWMHKLKLPEEKFTIIPNGINVEKFRCKTNKKEKRKQLGIKENSLIITCISKLRRGKGHDVLLKAFEKVYQNNTEVTLLIIGKGEKEKELKDSLKNFQSRNNILFLGNRDDIAEILSISNIFVLPTEKEGMSNAIIEAMVMGIPIITTDIPENRSLLEDKKTGILIPVNDSDSLFKKIELLASDRALWEKISQNSKTEATNRFDVRIVAHQLVNFYNKI